MSLNSYIDHTLLKADATYKDIENLCKEAVENKFFAVCVNPCWVKASKYFLKDSSVKIATVVGFPLGANMSEIKARETQLAIDEGADEVDMVMNISLFKSKEYDLVLDDIRKVRDHSRNRILKVIVETCLLSNEEKEDVLKIVLDSDADFIKTSTGFSIKGAEEDDVTLFRKIAGNRLQIKASGGIKSLSVAERMIRAGASRVGTSSGVLIMRELNERF